jgi:hypothetical protein
MQVLRIRITLKGRIWITIKVMSWIWIRIKLPKMMQIHADFAPQHSQNEWNMSLFEHLYKVLKGGSESGSA